MVPAAAARGCSSRRSHRPRRGRGQRHRPARRGSRSFRRGAAAPRGARWSRLGREGSGSSSRGGGASLRPPPPRGRCSPRRSSTPPRSRPAARASRRRLASSSRSTTPPRPRVPAQLTPSPAGPAPSDALRAQRAGPLIFPPGQGLYVVALVPTCKTPRRERGRARAQVGRGGASAQSPWTRAAWLLHGFT